MLAAQLVLLRRMAETLNHVDWKDWHVPVFLYLSTALAVRLGPVSRPLRPTMIGAAAAAAAVALIAMFTTGQNDLFTRIWPIMTYMWALLVLLLVITLLARGAVGLIGVLGGKGE